MPLQAEQTQFAILNCWGRNSSVSHCACVRHDCSAGPYRSPQQCGLPPDLSHPCTPFLHGKGPTGAHRGPECSANRASRPLWVNMCSPRRFYLIIRLPTLFILQTHRISPRRYLLRLVASRVFVFCWGHLNSASWRLWSSFEA